MPESMLGEGGAARVVPLFEVDTGITTGIMPFACKAAQSAFKIFPEDFVAGMTDRDVRSNRLQDVGEER